jgi:ABC-2 type transport system ATP-binding protein
MIDVKNLGKRYGALEAVKGVSFGIQAGEVVGLLGPNGAGKTTIMKILTCFMYPSYGTATLNGCDVFVDPLAIKRSVGYLPENAPLYTDLNVMEYLDFIADARGLAGSQKAQRIGEVIGECGLEPVVYRSIDTLSKGFRQRTGLAQAIVHNPQILILDEPTTGLDPNQIIEIRQLIKSLGKEKTVILSTHILQEVEATCNRVLILNEGRIVAQGTTEQINRELRGEVMLAVTVTGPRQPGPSLAAVAGVRELMKNEPAGVKSGGEAGPTGPREAGANRWQLALSVDPDSGVEERVFDWAVAEGYRIVALVPQRLSLEELFIKLTREGGANVQ